jgi:plastocyanin
MGRRAFLGILLMTLGCTAPASSVAPTAAAVLTSVPPTAVVPTTSPYKGAVVIEAAEQYFYPELITVSPGTTVLWKDVQGTHDMVAEDRSFASAVLFEGGTYSFTFTARGHYRYVCTLHVGAGMWAEVDVE